MKNKKLFAILTLLCFMMTLMPVAAFAAPTEAGAAPTVKSITKSGLTFNETVYEVVTSDSVYKIDLNNGVTTVTPEKGDKYVTVKAAATTKAGASNWVAVEGVNANTTYTVTSKDVEKYDQAIADADAEAGTGNAVSDISALVANDGDHSVLATKAASGVEFTLTALTAGEKPGYFGANTLFVWAKDANGNVTSALTGVTIDGVSAAGTSKIDNAILIDKGLANNAQVKVQFSRAGVYTVYAGVGDSAATKIGDVQLLNGGKTVSTITVIGSAVNPETYEMALNDNDPQRYTYTAKDGDDFTIANVTPNNVGKEQTLTFYNDGKKLTGKTVTIETGSANISVNKTSATTNVLGQVKFDLSASREGVYELYVTVDGVTFVINVTVGNTSAAYIETISQPSAPKAQFAGLPVVRFQVTDINGNVVKDALNAANANNYMGMSGIQANKVGGAPEATVKSGRYAFFTEKPAASALTNEDLTLTWNENKQAYDLSVGGKIMDVEGTYAVKVILDNGAFATAKWEVKKFQTPVELRVDYARTTVELGGTISPEQVVFVDANGVEKTAKSGEYDFAATGYAVYNLDGNKITVKTDEKYVGAKINVTAVSERYDLVDAVELTVADEAKDIAFADKHASVNVNNKITWNVVDAQGNKVALNENLSKTNISYVILDKPADAKVSTYDATIVGDLQKKGEGKMALTSDKVGNVTVQVVLKAEYKVTDSTQDAEKTQVKYYSGTQIFAVGNDSVGDVVVMSIGSNEIIVNDAKATIDAAPMVQNDRTYVPFRALAEAFGAEVAYDEATQAVTAELNGVKVVMTIGSATYTVNDAEKTMDVAPFINGSRTMVPVRFVAEAFGIKVIPTYDENGATADILFNL